MKKGFIREYSSEEESRLTYKSLVRYSFTENDPSPLEATVGNYLRAVVVDSYKGVKHYETTSLPYCSKFRNDKENFFLLGSKKDGEIFNDMQFVAIMTGILTAELAWALSL